MTRKKFIKNMMALDYDRNEANDKAELVHLAGLTTSISLVDELDSLGGGGDD